jgi:23S rRNA-/tRNA-specific pseudouridylate synthase
VKRFVTTEATRLDAVLAAMGLDRARAVAALVDGRVFVERKRARDFETPVPSRTEVVVHDARPDVALPDPFILLHRDALLAVDKPAGIPTIPDLEGARGSLLDLAARAAHESAEDLHPTSRLDRDVSGIVTFTLDEVARRRVQQARARGQYRRLYLAVACGALPRDRDVWRWSVSKHPDPRRRVSEPPMQFGPSPSEIDARPATSRVVVLRRHDAYLLLALAPETGRTHQLRIHAARAGAPLLGDLSYGGARRLTTSTGAVRAIDRIALHCAAVDLQLGREKISLRSPVPRALLALMTEVGLGRSDGKDEAGLVDEAIRCDPWRTT